MNRVFLTYSDALIHLGYDVAYLICHENGDLSDVLPGNLKIISLGDRKLRSSVVPLINFLHKNNVDIFITGGNLPNALSVLACRIARAMTKVIISHHNYFNIEHSTVFSKLLIKLFYNRATKVISVSDGITGMLLDNGVDADKVATIYNPIDIDYIKKCGDLGLKIELPSKYLLYVGRLGEVKIFPFY